MVDQSTKQIICTAHGKGRQYDFHLFKTSQVKLKAEIECLADKRYQGIQKLHELSRTPKKKPKGAQLSAEDKQLNRHLAKLRVGGEHVNRCLKVFKILSERYTNRWQRFGFWLNLIAGLYNFELGLTS